MPTNDPDRTAHRPDSSPNPVGPAPASADHFTRPGVPPGPISPGASAEASDTQALNGAPPLAPESPGSECDTRSPDEAARRPGEPGRKDPTETYVPAAAEVIERAARSGETRPPNRSTVPGFTIEKELGRGAMGVIYQARQTAVNRPVALKMILAGGHADVMTQARFLIEAEAVAALQHPHIVQLYEFGPNDGLPYFAMEFVGGGTLAERLRKGGTFRPMVAAEMVAKLADAMAAAHAKGIVHRDLKPANVLLTDTGEPKIADFGLARIGKSDMTATGAVMGTPSYMSPEQAAGKTREVGTPADVWALGAILYDLLTGRPPFRGDTWQATIQQVLSQEPNRPRATVPTIPRDLETICLKCLEKDPKKRYGTAAELAADLRAFLDGRPITARPVGTLERAWKWTKRHPGRAAGMAAGVLLTVGLVVAWTEVQADRANERLTAETKRLNDLRAADERRAEDRLSAETKRLNDLREADEKRAADLKAADDAAKRQQRQTRAGSLVEGLAAADTGVVPRLLTDLAEFHDLTGPKLRELAAQPVTTKPGLHARLALLADEPGRAGELAGYVPTCRPEELLPIRSALTPHAAAVAPGLWAVLTDANAEPGKRVRAAGALAGLTPQEERWKTTAPVLAGLVTRENPLEAVVWSQALAPMSRELLPALVRRYPEARGRIRSGKLSESGLVAEASGFDLTANLLARYVTDRPDVLADLAVIIDARHHRLFAQSIEANRKSIVPALREELGRVALVGPNAVGGVVAAVVGSPSSLRRLDPDPVYDAAAKRRANAAAVLLALEESESVWPLFRFPADGDPSARSYLQERLAGISVDPVVLIQRFRVEPDVSAKRALLIALGDYERSPVWAVEREALSKELLTHYRDHPDAGLHGAIDWLLRQNWGKGAELAAIDEEQGSAARGRVAARVALGAVPVPGMAGAMGVVCGPLLPAPGVGRDRDWYVNGQEQTYTVIRRPKEFTLGSPETEPGRVPVNEPAHRKRIGRSFAIATKEVTVEQFLRFKPNHSWLKRYSPDRDSPAVGMTWYEAVEYCNWLSEKEGIPEDQWCYEQTAGGKYAAGMKIKRNHLKLTGYRLPTEAEWEYACRGGAVVGRYYGRTEELLPRYGWYQKNAEDHAWPVGRLRPNDLGLFDTLGNALEWVEDAAQLYDIEESGDQGTPTFLQVNEQQYRLLRGGSLNVTPVLLRCATRVSIRPSFDSFSNGFRPARTSPD